MKSITHFFINYKMFLPPFPSSCSLSALPIFCYSTFGHVCCTDFWSFTNESYQKNYEKKKKKHQKPLAPLPYICGRKGIYQVCVCVCVCARARTACASCSVISNSWFTWPVARETPLSLEFSRQEYRVSCITGRFFTIRATREVQ